MKFVLNFKQQFAPLVVAGVKTHTIRALRDDGRDPLPGDELALYTGLRTKGTVKLLDTVVEYVAGVSILPAPHNAPSVMLGSRQLQAYEVETLAVNDGFATMQAFIDFFQTTYGLPFKGQLTGWAPPPPYVVTKH